MISLFFEALLLGVLAAVAIVALWRLAQRIGLAMPRTRPRRRAGLRCVRPLDFHA